MKTFFVPARQLVAALGGAALLWGCSFEPIRAQEEAKEKTASQTAEAPPTPGPASAEPAPGPNPATSTNAANATTSTNETSTVTVTAPTDLSKLPERFQELVKMAERGLGDDLLISWIKTSATPFNPSSDVIVHLTDLGISEEVLKVLIEHRGASGIAPAPTVAQQPIQTQPINPQVGQVPATSVPAPAAPQTPSVTVAATPEFEAAPQTPVQQPATVVQQPVQYNYFYNSLAPYGSWVDISGYGYCWRPTVAVVDRGWRPYSNRGRWVYTDAGWYWQSDYSWGWAAFHYGRWWNHPRCGWVWAPDNVWAPAWVTWRVSDAYCGWAPLPPGCHYRSGFGLSYFSAGVGLSFDFGLSSACYTYIPARRFCDRTPWRHRVGHDRHDHVHKTTTVINNITHNNTTIINEGPGRTRIASLTRSEVPKVALRDLPSDNLRTIPSDRFERGGRELAVYRPIKPTVPTAGAGGGTRTEVPKALAAGSPRGLASDSPRALTTIPSRPGANPGLVPSVPSPVSRGNLPGNNLSQTPDPAVVKPGVDARSQRAVSSTRALNNAMPVLSAPGAAPRPSVPVATAAPKPAVETRSGASFPAQTAYTPINPSPVRETPRAIRSQPGTISSTPSIAVPAPNTTPAPQPIAPQLMNQRPAPSARTYSTPQPVTLTPSAPQPNYQPAPVSRPVPSYRQEVPKPINVAPAPAPSYSQPRVQSYTPPRPQTYSPPPPTSYGGGIRSVPSNPSFSAPQPVRPTPSVPAPAYSAPRPAPAPAAPSRQTSVSKEK